MHPKEKLLYNSCYSNRQLFSLPSFFRPTQLIGFHRPVRLSRNQLLKLQQSWKSLRGGRNHRIMCEERRHTGSAKIYGKTISLLIGPDTTFITKGSVFANRAGHYIYQEEKCLCLLGRTLHLLGREVFLLIEPDIIFIMKGSVFANRAGHYIY